LYQNASARIGTRVIGKDEVQTPVDSRNFVGKSRQPPGDGTVDMADVVDVLNRSAGLPNVHALMVCVRVAYLGSYKPSHWAPTATKKSYF